MTIVIGFIIYIFIFMMIKFFYLKSDNNESNEGFFLANRGLGYFIGSLTYAATTYSSFMMVGMVGLIFNTGIGAMYFELSYLIATFFIIIFVGDKLRQVAKDKGFISPMELFAYKYGKGTSKIGCLVCLLALLPYTAGQFIGIGVVLTSFGISYTTGVLLAATFTFILMFSGGMRGVALSDAIQGIFMLVCAILALMWSKETFTGFITTGQHDGFWTTTTYINFMIPWLFFALTNPQVVQRLFAMKNKTDIRKMAYLFCGFGLLFTGIVSFIGFSASFGAANSLFNNNIGTDQVTPQLLTMMPNYLASLVALSILFAALSTANSNLLTLTSMIQVDLITKKSNRIVFALMLLLTGAVLVVAMLKPTYIVSLAVSTARILLGFVPLYVGILLNPDRQRPSSYQGIATIMGTASVTLLCINYIPQYNSLITFASAFGIYYLFGLYDVKKQSTLSL